MQKTDDIHRNMANHIYLRFFNELKTVIELD